MSRGPRRSNMQAADTARPLTLGSPRQRRVEPLKRNRRHGLSVGSLRLRILFERVLTMAVLLTIEEVAERFGTSPRFVRRLVAERRIAFNKIGRHVRISMADVEAF